jgi:hypothetical protein
MKKFKQLSNPLDPDCIFNKENIIISPIKMTNGDKKFMKNLKRLSDYLFNNKNDRK